MRVGALKLYPYKMGSESAKLLAESLGVKRVRPDGGYRPKHDDVIINWGSGKVPSWTGGTILNKPEAVRLASNKLLTFQTLEAAGVKVPQFTTDIRTARYWLEDGHTIMERHVLNGNSGAGIRVVSKDEDAAVCAELDLTPAPLYTRFIPKTKEFRVHIFRGEVIGYSQKRRRGTSEARPSEFNPYISSAEMGWVFCITDIDHIDGVKEIAKKATSTLGLDFAAVDVIFHDDISYVLEVNTAPGLAPSTLMAYANKFRSFIGEPVVTTRTNVSTGVGGVEPVSVDLDEVVLRLDKVTARKLHQLLSGLI